MSNPLDAFSRPDQSLYLDWLAGDPDGDAALRNAPNVVLVRRHSETARRVSHDRRLREIASDATAVLYVKLR
jgi:hypothetical protein